MYQGILDLPRNRKKIIALVVDISLLSFAFIISCWLSTGKTIIFSNQTLLSTLFVVSSSVITLYLLGLYRAVLRFVASRAIISIALGLSIGSLAIYLLPTEFSNNRPLATALIFWSFGTLLIAGIRIIARHLILSSQSETRKKVVIYGAGSAGIQVSVALQRGKEYQPIAFVDDKSSLNGTNIEGIHVFPSQSIEHVLKKYKCSTVLLAIPSASQGRRKEILQFLEPFDAEIKTMPGMADIVSGKARIDELQDVEIEDLLGRDSVPAKETLLRKCITGKQVMVSGAGGSIGSELCRQIVLLEPKTLVLYEICEFSLYKIEQILSKKLRKHNLKVELVPILGSVQNRSRLLTTMKTFHVNTVYHAAAYKHVPLVEENTIEGVRNNIFGTLNTAEAAADAKVETFVLISTDKAVRPTNTMGATKRMAELILQALTAVHPDTTFCMVRFGNVLGSSGSVVPLFREQIKNGGPITVTHPRIIRYFMTIPEAALLVIQAGSMGTGGDVFLLDMGEPVLITDLAKRMIRLSGLILKNEERPDGDIEIEFTGLRPGEKLYEELLVGGENVSDTDHSRILKAREKFLNWTQLKDLLQQLDNACSNQNHELVRELLIKAPTDFTPSSELCDHIYIMDNNEELNDTNIINIA